MKARTAPRQLRVLRIDDDLTSGGNPKAPGFRAQRASRHLATVDLDDCGQPKPGIGSWADAMAFWTLQKGAPEVDLVISDVRFDDDTSPLVTGWNLPRGAWLPTGLSHFKAFAALARATGRPLGVGLHTKEPRIWRKLSDEQDPFFRLMANLAAQEIGELAALLGEGAEVNCDADSCWRWLEDRTFDATEFREAVPYALADFRKKLGACRLLPRDYERMVEWCGSMEAFAAAGSGTAKPLDDGTDRGFPVMFPDGTHQLLSLRSLFADVLLKRPRFQFEREGLPRHCFALQPDDAFYSLDGEGNPKIGALVYQCGEYGRAAMKALEILNRLAPEPGRNTPLTLADARRAVDATWLPTALAVLFQDIYREWQLFQAWRPLYQEHEWHPIADSFGPRTDDETKTLRSWLKKVSKCVSAGSSISHEDVMAMFEAAGFDRNDPLGLEADSDLLLLDDEDIDDEDLLPEEREEEDSKDCTQPAKRRGWVGTRRCIDLLTKMGVLELIPGTRRYGPGSQAFSPVATPPVPKWLPRNFMKLSELGPTVGTEDDRLLNPNAALKRMFGYHRKANGKEDTNSMIQHALVKGLGLSGDSEATSFMEWFRRGAPQIGWVKEACRDYARQLPWDDETGWPESLR